MGDNENESEKNIPTSFKKFVEKTENIIDDKDETEFLFNNLSKKEQEGFINIDKYFNEEFNNIIQAIIKPILEEAEIKRKELLKEAKTVKDPYVDGNLLFQ